MRKVKWGVLGVAKIAIEKVIPAMQQGEASHIAAIASRDLGKARAAADKLGIERAFGSYEALLADGEIEAIYNPLPNELHVPWTLRALAAGKHVLCEKPIALDAEEARSLIEARDRSGKLVAEAFMVRFHPQWRRAKELAATGAVGELRAIQTFFSYRLLDPENVRNRPPGGGGLYDIGCYAILSARYIFGAEPTRVAATIDHDPNFRTDRLAGAILEFPGGRLSTFTVGTQMSAHQRVTIVGEAGRIEIMIPFNAPPDRPTEIAIDTGADLFGGGRRVEQFAICDQYTLQGDAFSRAILNATPLEFPIEDAILPTCASSTPCSARRRAERGRRLSGAAAREKRRRPAQAQCSRTARATESSQTKGIFRRAKEIASLAWPQPIVFIGARNRRFRRMICFQELDCCSLSLSFQRNRSSSKHRHGGVRPAVQNSEKLRT